MAPTALGDPRKLGTVPVQMHPPRGTTVAALTLGSRTIQQERTTIVLLRDRVRVGTECRLGLRRRRQRLVRRELVATVGGLLLQEQQGRQTAPQIPSRSATPLIERGDDILREPPLRRRSVMKLGHEPFWAFARRTAQLPSRRGTAGLLENGIQIRLWLLRPAPTTALVWRQPQPSSSKSQPPTNCLARPMRDVHSA